MARQQVARNEPAQQTGPAMTAQEREELDARLERMLSKPHKRDLGGGNYFLLWVTCDDNGSAQTMIWNPETEEEIRGASLFYDAAHGLGAFVKQVTKGKALHRGTTEVALINGILQNRDDETGYLVYADYLTENGNTQGDFIRLCTEMKRLKPGAPVYEAKNDRAGELVEAHAEEWFAPLGAIGLRPVLKLHDPLNKTLAPWLWLSTKYGVIDEITIDRLGLLPDSADRLFAAAPFLRKLTFELGQVELGLNKVKQLAQIEELNFAHAELTTEALARLLRSKYLLKLKSLLLTGNDISYAGVLALTKWPGLAQLEALELSGCAVGPEAITELARCERTTGIVRLRVGNNGITADSANALIRSPHLGKLAKLDLSGAELDSTAASAFAGAAFARTLQQLDLESVTFQSGAFAQLVRNQFPALESLKLNNVRLRVRETTQLAGAVFTTTLKELLLDNCELGVAGVEALVAARFPALTTLDLSRNRLGSRGGTALMNAAPSFPALTTLKLWDNKLNPDSVMALADNPLLANLTELDLNGNKIGPAGAMALAHSKYLKHLKTFTVDEKTVGKKGKQALLDRFGEGVISWR